MATVNGYESALCMRVPTSSSSCSDSDTIPLIVKQGRKGQKGFVIVLTLFSALGGFLFGYDTGVVSGAMLKVRDTFSLSSTWVELIVSITIAFAALAALGAGFLCDFIGRRPVLILASVIFTLGAIIMAASVKAWMLLIGRAVVGVGIGLAAMAVPMYIAELAPADMRGKLVVVNVLFITGGQFLATIVDGIFSYLDDSMGWRFMFGLAGVPSLVMFVGFLFMPESPRWLVFHGRLEKAREVLKRVRHSDEVLPELQSIVKDHEEHTRSKLGVVDFARKFCTSRSVLLALLVGCGLQLFQQFGGINTVMYYGASILKMAGFADEDAIWLATVPAGANFAFTILGLLLVDRIGRRKLLISSVTGVILSILLLSATFFLMDHFSLPSRPYGDSCLYHNCGSCVGNSECGFCVAWDEASNGYFNGTCNSIAYDGATTSKYLINGSCALFGERTSLSSMELGSGSGIAPDKFQWKWFLNSCPGQKLAPLAIVALFLYIATFAPGFGPLPWTINSEIYPTWARSTAISIATMVNWSFNLLVSMTFLTMADALGQPATFGLYAGLSFLGLIFIVFFVPETRGRSLEEVEPLFRRPYFMNYWWK